MANSQVGLKRSSFKILKSIFFKVISIGRLVTTLNASLAMLHDSVVLGKMQQFQKQTISSVTTVLDAFRDNAFNYSSRSLRQPLGPADGERAQVECDKAMEYTP